MNQASVTTEATPSDWVMVAMTFLRRTMPP
jgi:hypothetical protein